MSCGNSGLRLIAFALATLSVSSAAQLKETTLSAWNDYLQDEKTEVDQRAHAKSDFLWAAADENRLRQIRAGAVVVESVGAHNPMRVPSGLIHHWIGAAFIPHASVEDVMAVTRDYARYKDYYKPGVTDAKSLSSEKGKDQFTIRFANASVIARTSLEGEYTCQYTRIDDKRWYSVSRTTQTREVKDPGRPDEKRLPPDQGSGYIWRLYSTVRMQESDGGVIVELEALALSRDVPVSLRWLIDPVIRRISRDSVEKSLSETSQAVRSRYENIAQSSRYDPGIRH